MKRPLAGESHQRPLSEPHRSQALRLAIVGLFLVAFVGGALLAQRGLFQAVKDATANLDLDAPASADAQVQRFTVRPGEPATTIGERLEAARLIRSAIAFRLLARSRGVESRLAAGDYELRPSMRPSDIMDIMAQQAEPTGINVTFPEGWRMEEMADRLEASGIVSRTEFLRVVGEVPFQYSFLPQGRGGREGFLFPDTYTFAPTITATAVVENMLRNFDRRFDISMRQQAERARLSIAQVVAIASIVEREAVVPEERPMIAEVFLNRLAVPMPLQADPTVQYAVAPTDPISALQTGYWKRDLTITDLQIDSPYNTYKNRGLPPGAICNPGLASIKAVVAPTSTGYLYFVAKADGSHAFARTLDEHNENVARYRDLSRAR